MNEFNWDIPNITNMGNKALQNAWFWTALYPNGNKGYMHFLPWVQRSVFLAALFPLLGKWNNLTCEVKKNGSWDYDYLVLQTPILKQEFRIASAPYLVVYYYLGTRGTPVVVVLPHWLPSTLSPWLNTKQCYASKWIPCFCVLPALASVFPTPFYYHCYTPLYTHTAEAEMQNIIYPYTGWSYKKCTFYKLTNSSTIRAKN